MNVICQLNAAIIIKGSTNKARIWSTIAMQAPLNITICTVQA